MVGTCTVVGPARAPELRERHHGDTGGPSRVEHLIKAFHRGVQFGHAFGVLFGLASMRVEVAKPCGQHPETQIAVDQAGGHLELGDDPGARQGVAVGHDRGERLGDVELVDKCLRHCAVPGPLGIGLHVADRLIRPQ